MRCPKCGFNSFDHNLVCPKCHRDLTAARTLLNLSVPAPGAADLFSPLAAGITEAIPEALPEVEIAPEPVDLAEPEVEVEVWPEPVDPAEPEAPEPAAESDDIEPVDALEEIEPEEDDDDDIAPLASPDEELEDIAPAGDEEELEDITPAGDEEDEELEDIAPAEGEAEAGLPEPGSFAAHLAGAQAAEQPPGDEEIEIELADDDTEDVYAEPAGGIFDAARTVAPAALAAMDQIKSALTATGDLAAETPEAEPEEDAPAGEPAEIVLIDEADELEAELEGEADGLAADGTGPPDAPAPDGHVDDESEFGDLSDLVSDIDLADIDEKI